MFDLNRLRILRAVVASGSVNETARRLGYRPSTVSQHLKTLSTEVGFPLVEHVGRGIRPTPAAVELSKASVEVLDANARLEATARELRSGVKKRLTIATFASAAYAWMPSITRTLRREFPGLTLELSINEAEGVESAGRADIEIHTELLSETTPVPPAYGRRVLGIDDFVMALPLEHPLADRETADLRDFADDEWVQYDFRDHVATRITALSCAEAGFTPRYVARAQDHVTGLAFVSAGVGVTVVPQLASHWSDFDVAYVRPLNPTPQRRIVALVRDRAGTNPAAIRTVALLSALGRELGRRAS
ncbi:MAG: LysR family transcriptional regulator [Propionibacteriaceae bacterium]|nr:LysR family transcriptional regulator [Micropruina sp.]HBY23906.1 LysR family transcriptional regulator [Propionibacteriaceae bacterium]